MGANRFHAAAPKCDLRLRGVQVALVEMVFEPERLLEATARSQIPSVYAASLPASANRPQFRGVLGSYLG